ncbi:MAG: hypothetical protein JRJ62_15690 [Deltaproteobacteria bacterium]|nr:hypothetical protein [Deltaproteobacteria bacterium]
MIEMACSDPKWIKVDIDGNGERWLLCFERDGQLIFPMEEFEDDCENYTKEISCPIYTPEQLMEIKNQQMALYNRLVELAIAVCKTASGTYNDKRSSVSRAKLQALNNFLFEREVIIKDT